MNNGTNQIERKEAQQKQQQKKGLKRRKSATENTKEIPLNCAAPLFLIDKHCVRSVLFPSVVVVFFYAVCRGISFTSISRTVCQFLVLFQCRQTKIVEKKSCAQFGVCACALCRRETNMTKLVFHRRRDIAFDV